MPKKIFNIKYIFWLLQIMIFLFSFKLLGGELLQSFDLDARSLLMNTRNEIGGKKLTQNISDITLVGIDEDFFAKAKKTVSGLHRGYYAKAFANINDEKPAALAIDVFFQEQIKYEDKQDPNSQTLNKIYQDYDTKLTNSLTNNNILAASYDWDTQQLLPPSTGFVLPNDVQVGHIVSFQDIQNISLGVYPYLMNANDNQKLYAMSIPAYITYYEHKLKQTYDMQQDISANIQEDDNHIKIQMPKKQLDIPISSIDSKNFLFTPIYVSHKNELNYIGFFDVYTGNFNEDLIKNKLVFVGATDPTLNDIKNSLVGNIDGVLFHINQTLSLINQDFIVLLDSDTLFWIVVLILILNTVLLALFRRSKSVINVFILFVGEILVLIILGILFCIGGIYNIFGMNYSIFLPLGSLLAIIGLHFVISLIYILGETSFIKENIRKLFGLYVSKDIADSSSDWSKKEKIAKQKNIALFFSDIAGYTSLSEQLSPKQNIDILNAYLEAMSKQIANYQGFIDKYIGDAIMAFWEQENGCDLAAHAAVMNIQALNEFNQNMNVNLDIRIGLHYGQTIVGDIGAQDFKLNYTVIGDNVNLASRLEGINKYYHTQICASGEFIQQVNDKDKFIYRQLDLIQVKGKQTPTKIYEIIGYQQQDNDYEFINIFEQGLNLYIQGDFSEAKSLFEQVYKLNKDEVAQIFIQRCEYLTQNPPKLWNGIWKFDTK